MLLSFFLNNLALSHNEAVLHKRRTHSENFSAAGIQRMPLLCSSQVRSYLLKQLSWICQTGPLVIYTDYKKLRFKSRYTKMYSSFFSPQKIIRNKKQLVSTCLSLERIPYFGGWVLLWNRVQACQKGSMDFSLKEGLTAGPLPVSTANYSTLMSTTPFLLHLDYLFSFYCLAAVSK